MFLLHLPLPVILFFFMLILSVISGFLTLIPRMPLGYIRIHIMMMVLPLLVALWALFNTNGNNLIGPWNLDSLAWFMACFVLTVGLVIQRFSMRYLLGDRYYRNYFALLTMITVTTSVAWLSDDLRWFLACWGMTLIGLIRLISLNKAWKVTRVAGRISGRVFAVSWFSLLISSFLLHHVTGTWALSLALTQGHLDHMGSLDRLVINLLLVLAVIIPAAQWPFQRWLIESVVAPTPVSAIMHAGLVNAGGIILTRFSPLFHGGVAQILLLILSCLSVLIGTGISLVQVDYKRQLVGSTIAQMGFMLIQCALGAYLAAIIHLVLHGLFKATLFLQSGSAVQHHSSLSRENQQSSKLWVIAGLALGFVTGISFWLMSSGGSYKLINALILGWSISFSWTQMITLGKGRVDRLAGFILLSGSALVYFFIHRFFYNWLHTAIDQSVQLPLWAVVLAVILLVVGSIINVLASRKSTSVVFAVIYLWLVHSGEGHRKSVNSHPSYLKQYPTKEVSKNEHHIHTI